MGQAISSVIASFENNAEKEKQANDALNAMLEMAKLQVEAFRLSISNPNFDAKLIPIETIISAESLVQASVSSEPTKIGETITETFGAFADGEVAKGISTLVSKGLNILMGSYSGNSSTRDIYLISTGDIGGVWRLDIHLFSYRYTSTQLTDIAKNVLAVSIVLSSADISKLSDNALRVIVQNTYNSSDQAQQQQIFEQIKAARDGTRKPAVATAAHSLHRSVRKLAGHAALQGTASSTDPVEFTRKAMFSITTPIGQAEEQTPVVRAWVASGVGCGITHALSDDSSVVSVSCAKAEDSTSNSVITGEVTVTAKYDFDLVHVVKETLLRAGQGFEAPFDMLNYVVEKNVIEA